ncbi:MAG: alkaline phosphatase family protein [Polyangiales bacterium]
MERAAAGLRIALGLALAAAGYLLENHVVPRLSDHRGHLLLAHDDRVTVALPRRPRRALVVVVDGLTAVDARGLASVRRLAARGRCVLTDVGLPSVSRPVYATLSSGVEQARTGVRNNDDTSPAPVDSLWERAHDAGLRVSYRSELPWWGQLFPRGFDRAVVGRAADDLLAAPVTDDLTLVHPVYVDDLSHDHGRDSPEVRAALRRLDGELAHALDRLDPALDLVALTADHGHRAAGGHGGASPEVTRVLTCFAGPGVRRGEGAPLFDVRDVAPTLAVLLGVPFPHHAATRRDPRPMLDAVVDRNAVGRGYFDARLEGLARIRRRAADELAARARRPNATWADLDELALRPRRLRALLAAALSALVVTVTLRRALPCGDRLAALAWALAVTALFVAVYGVVAGGLDATSINGRGLFTRNVLAAVATALALGALWHRQRGGSWRALAGRAWGLTALAACANAAHVAAYGWPLGYPLPGPFLYFAPFLLGALLCAAGAAAAGFEARALTDRSAPRPPP